MLAAHSTNQHTKTARASAPGDFGLVPFYFYFYFGGTLSERGSYLPGS